MPVDREGPIHRSILAYLRREYPAALIHHSRNEMNLKASPKSKAIAQSKAKAMGMLTGFPDLMMLNNGSFWAFEVKAKGNYASDKQKAVGALIEANGGKWAVVRSIDDVKGCISEWNDA
jgi:hypothetical protein